MGFIWNTYIAMAQTFLRPDLRKRKNLINSKNYSTKKNEHKNLTFTTLDWLRRRLSGSQEQNNFTFPDVIWEV